MGLLAPYPPRTAPAPHRPGGSDLARPPRRRGRPRRRPRRLLPIPRARPAIQPALDAYILRLGRRAPVHGLARHAPGAGYRATGRLAVTRDPCPRDRLGTPPVKALGRRVPNARGCHELRGRPGRADRLLLGRFGRRPAHRRAPGPTPRAPDPCCRRAAASRRRRRFARCLPLTPTPTIHSSAARPPTHPPPAPRLDLHRAR